MTKVSMAIFIPFGMVAMKSLKNGPIRFIMHICM